MFVSAERRCNDAMSIKIVRRVISRAELKKLAVERFGDLVKAVVDVDQGIMAVGGELHADEEVLLMERESSKRENTWGINLSGIGALLPL